MSTIDFRIRLAGDDDIDACVAVCAANYPGDILLHEIEEYRGFLAEKPYAPSPYFVVEIDGAVVACGGVAIDGEAAHLCWGLVHPDWHGRGLGTALVNHRLNWSKSQPGLKAVELYTSQRQCTFYERFGFETTKVTKDGLGPDFDRYDMTLSL